MLEYLPVMVFTLNMNGEVLFANRHALQVTGYKLEELLGKNWRQVFLGHMAHDQAHKLEEALLYQEVEGLEIALQDKDHKRIPVGINTTLLFVDGKMDAVLLTGVDLTQTQMLVEELSTTLEEVRVSEEEIRVQNQVLLESQERALKDRQRYSDLFQFAPDGYLVSDANGIILEANRAAANLLQVQPANISGKPLVVYLNPQERHTFHAMLGRLQRSTRTLKEKKQDQVTQGWETMLELRSGETIPVILIAAARPNESGHIETIRWLLQNISQRKQAEQALRKSEQRFRTIFEQAPVGMLLTDMRGFIMESNSRLQNMLGYRQKELQGLNPITLIDSEDQKTNQQMFSELLRGEREAYQSEVRFRDRNGKVVWATLSASVILGENNQSQFAVKMIEDITARKQAEAELEEVQRRLMDSIESERLHLAQELHDGPVQDLYGLTFKLKAFQNMLESAELSEQLGELQEHLKQIVQNLRQTSSELRPPTLAPFGLEKAIRSHSYTFQRAHPEVEIDLQLAADRQMLPEHVRLTLFRIYEQALVNIARHANASQVRVVFNFDAEQLLLTIKDNGQGFDVPERWINMVRDGHLGLAGISERTESIGGDLTVESEPGKGTLLRVCVPRQENWEN